MSLRSRALGAAAFALSLYLSGCGSATAPASLADPATTAANAAALDSAFSASIISNFQTLSGSMQAAPPIARASLSAVRTLPLVEPGSRYSTLVGVGRQFQQLIPKFVSVAASALFPDTLLGSVYTWNTGTQSYQRDSTTGGPANGVRFWLYAIDPFSRLPATPLTPVGYVNLLDESAGGTATVHVQVKGASGSPTYLDYTFSGSGTTSSFNASVTGTLTNGLGGLANKTLTFSMTIGGNSSSVTFTSTYTLNNPAITVTETVTVADNGTTSSLTVNFNFSRPGETINVAGSVAISDADGTGTVNVTFKVNGGTFATITGSVSNPVYTRAGGGQLTPDELQAVGSLFQAAADMSEKVGELFVPAQIALGL